MMVSLLERPFRPVDLTATSFEAFDLDDLATRLMQEPRFLDEGRSGITLVRDAQVSIVLEVLRKGSGLREHRAPASAMVSLLSGRATFVSGPDGTRTEMLPGTLVVFASDLDHALVAEEDSSCLIVIGGRGAGTPA